MCFWKRKKKQMDKSEESLKGNPEVEKLEEFAGNLSLMMKHEVTRFDVTEAYVKALVDLHPEVKEHPRVIDLVKREKAYRKEKER